MLQSASKGVRIVAGATDLAARPLRCARRVSGITSIAASTASKTKPKTLVAMTAGRSRTADHFGVDNIAIIG